MREILGKNGFIELFFMITGHSHNIIDKRHSLVQKKWSTTPFLHSISDWENMINGIPNFSACELIPFDFKSWLAPCINPDHHKLLLSSIHVFRFTTSGLITKRYVQENFSEWRGRSNVNGADFEPFKVVIDSPKGLPENLTPRGKG